MHQERHYSRSSGSVKWLTLLCVAPCRELTAQAAQTTSTTCGAARWSATPAGSHRTAAVSAAAGVYLKASWDIPSSWAPTSPERYDTVTVQQHEHQESHGVRQEGTVSYIMTKLTILFLFDNKNTSWSYRKLEFRFTFLPCLYVLLMLGRYWCFN